MKQDNFVKRFCSLKNITWAAVIVFALTLLPVFYLSFVNRATGDDYGYGTYTRAAWLATHSLVQVGKAACRTIRQYYYGWQGTWFSIFLFSLQPEVFSDRAYVIVAFLMLILWIGSTFLLFREVLFRRMKLEKWSYRLITIVFLIISIQFIPSTKSSIFWFNGCAHYMIPFAMCQCLMYFLLKYEENYRIRYLVGISILMTLLGGSNYQAAVFALIVTFYVGIVGIIVKRDKRIWWLCLPIMLEFIGLILSMKAPGNKVRGGEDFGLSFMRGGETIGLSFLEGMRTIGNYMQIKPLAMMGLLLLFLLFLVAFKKRGQGYVVKYPVTGILLLFCLYSAMQAPAIYAGVEVSGGVHNMNYQVFLLTASGILMILAQQIMTRFSLSSEKRYRRILFSGLLICLLILVFGRSNIKTSTLWVCMEYITTGQAVDYKEQMELQTHLLTDGDTQDVVLPFINDVQGPLMHMPVTPDSEAWTNTVTREFYGKNSVVAMPRSEWEELYGN